VQDHKIILKKVKVHNLKGVDLTLNTNELIVFTGVSGSGKSSLAFDTIYIEGQRKYLESLSKGAKRYIKEMTKPDAEKIEGITPTIAVEQSSIQKNERSTVGTITGIYDFLRVLYAKIGIPHCPISDEPLKAQSKEKIISTILKSYPDKRLIILAPYAENKKSDFKQDFKKLANRGFTKVRIDNVLCDLEFFTSLDETKAHTIEIAIDRFQNSQDNGSRLTEAVSQALDIGHGVFTLLVINNNSKKEKTEKNSKEIEEEKGFSTFAYSEKSKKSYGALEPMHFSFNHPMGACERCHGLGHAHEFDLEKIIDADKSIKEDCCSIASSYRGVRQKNIYENLARIYKFDINTPFKDLPRRAKNVFLNGCNKKYITMHFNHPTKKNVTWKEFVKWKGVLFDAHKRIGAAKSDIYKNRLKKLMTIIKCPDCDGNRIKKYPAATKIDDTHIADICKMTIDEAIVFFKNINLIEIDKLISEDLLKEILKKLHFLSNVGLGYLTLERTAPTLSGGEGQRVKLSGQIGAGLVGTTYVLDEPSIGLHPQDHKKLIKTLIELQRGGNTVIVVEHDKDTMKYADTIVDVGPGAGYKGGEIVFQGSYSNLLKDKNSLTGKYLSNELQIKIPKKRIAAKIFLEIKKASCNNLQDVDVKIPLRGRKGEGLLVCVTGVSGSGKSSLISDTLYPALSNKLNKSSLKEADYEEIKNIDKLDKAIFVDQSPIGRTPRSNPATYIKVFDDIRKLFAELPESKMYGYTPGHFSFNVKEGSCPYCKGMGFVKVDLDFFEDSETICQECEGKRFDNKILNVKYKEKNIYDILNMEIIDAAKLFENIPNIYKKLELLLNVGLDYIHLGQSATTLSGGEAQRIKLSKELARPSTGKTFYILDEPTTGLHFDDIKKLIEILKKLTVSGNTVLVIEHNLDLIKSCDYIIDLGPGAGKNGGIITGYGTPEQIAKENTPTGIFLKKELDLTKSFSKKIDLVDKNSNDLKSDLEKNEKIVIQDIIVKNATHHNLKSINCNIPHNKLTVITGPSGSGKTSLAFDTIFSEAQRRYIEALPHTYKQFFNLLPKAKVEKIENLSPAIAIEQKGHITNPRSTVGTLTEVYDLFRIIFANLGIAHCPETKEKIKTISKEFVANKLLKEFSNEKAHILAFTDLGHFENFENFLDFLEKAGFLRIRLNGKYYEVDEKNIPIDPSFKNEVFIVVDRIVIKENSKKRLLLALDTAAKISNKSFVVALEKKDLFFNLAFAVPSTGKSYPAITPSTFSFNSEKGMCLECTGLGKIITGLNFDDAEFFENSIEEIFEEVMKDSNSFTYDLYIKYFEKLNINPYTALSDLSEKDKQIFLEGCDKTLKIKNFNISWVGFNRAIAFFAKHAHRSVRWQLFSMIEEKTCPKCNGARLNPLALNVLLDKKSISDIISYPIEKLLNFSQNVYEKLDQKNKKILEEIFLQILKKLEFLKNIGLHYISIGRSTPSLSRGELQRTFLARQLGSGLSSCLYILDEPTIGLHPHNSFLLNNALKKLKEQNNTIIIVEHDPQTIKEADYILDFGPKAGIDGGKIIARGTLTEILKDKNSLTGRYLSGLDKIYMPTNYRTAKNFIKIKNANIHNLKNLSVDIPLNVICSITGVSGAGKSTLINHILKKALKKSFLTNFEDIVDLEYAKVSGLSQIDKTIYLGQDPTFFTSRADVMTYSEIAPHVRAFFASLPSAKIKGLITRNFSYNMKRGMCKNCYGLGYKNIELQYLPPVKVKCDVCNGYRLTKQSLEITYKGKHFGNLLSMSLIEARNFFDVFPKIVKRLDNLINVGLGYLKLGQDIASLSGGEIQRVKLAKELAKRASSNTIYIFDEPTVGLNHQDIDKLLKIFHSLANKGHSLIIIEHNSEVIANSDYVIDIGPEAGEKGGEIIYSGPIKNFKSAKNRSSTFKYISSLLKN
jgi:excinuclease ABC subunit A